MTLTENRSRSTSFQIMKEFSFGHQASLPGMMAAIQQSQSINEFESPLKNQPADNSDVSSSESVHVTAPLNASNSISLRKKLRKLIEEERPVEAI